MAEQELNLHDIVRRLPAAETAHVSADLWPRIAAAHLARQQRRRAQRWAGGALAAAALLALAIIGPAWFATPPAIDWQARAQALELQLNALAARGDANGTVDAELVRIDASLQAAYDRGAPANEVIPLWKQRSDLLGALLSARQQQVRLTRI